MRTFLLLAALTVAGVRVEAQCGATVAVPASQNLCAGSTTAAVAFTGSATSYTWTNNNTATGLAGSGTGNIAAFTATNSGTAPIVSNVTVTPNGSSLQGYAYVPNNGSGNVSVINLVTGSTVATIPTAGEPFAVTVLPDRSKVFVSTVTGGRVEVINTATNDITQHAPYNAPHGLVASPDGSRVYVNGWGGGGAVSYINTANPTSSTFMTSVANPEGMAITPDGNTLYVASAIGGLVAINTSTNISTFVAAGTNPHGVAITPNGQFVYTANNGSDNVTVVNTATNAVIATIPVGDAPLGIAVTPDGSRVYVANSGTDNVSVINTTTNTVIATISVGDYPYGVSVTPDGSQVYVTNKNSNNLSVIATVTNTVSTSLATGASPIGLGNFLSAAMAPCSGTPASFDITVNPIASVDQPADQAACAGSNVPALAFSGSATSYEWTNSNTAIGLPASGTGNLPAFVAPSVSSPQTATITVTPRNDVTQSAAPLPELLFYMFEGGGTSVSNLASAPPAGTSTATINGSMATSASPSICSRSLVGTGLGSGVDYVNTGWATNLSGSWTLSFKTSNVPSTTTTYYVLGDVNAGGFRVFTGGVAGAGNWILRGPFADVLATGGASTATTTTTFVYDAGVGEIRAYVNGTLVNTVAQAPFSVLGAGPFKVGGYSTSNSLPSGSLMDDFRLYSRPLSLAEVQTLNACGTYLSCTGTPKTFTVTINPTPSWNNAGFSTSICHDQGIGLSISNGGNTPGADYSWTNDNPAIGTPATGSGNALTFTGTNTGLTNISGLFTVTPSYTGGGVTCAGSPNTFTITVKPRPTLSAGTVNNVSCNGGANGSATVLASGGNGVYTYSWFPSGGTGAAVSGLVAGTYTVTVTSNGCFSTMPFTVSQPTAMTATTASTNVLCNGGATGSASVNVSGGTTPYSYLWSPSGGTAATATGLAVGNYSVLVTDGNGCTLTRNFTINQPSILGATTSQTNGTCTFGGIASVTPFGGAGGYTYLWSTGATTQSVSGLPAGLTSVLITDANGCTVTKNFNITAPPKASINPVSNQSLCAGSSSSAVVFSGSNGSTYSWTNNTPSIGLAASGTGNIPAFVTSNATASPVTATITVNLSGAPGACAADPRTFTITVSPAPTASISYAGSPFCASGTVSPTFTGTGGGAYSSTAGLSLNATSGVIDLAASTPGAYLITYTIPAGNGCPQVQTAASVVLNEYATVGQPSNQTVCAGIATTAVNFTGTGGSYSWTNDNASIGLAASGTGNIASFTATNPGNTVQSATVTVTPQGTGPFAYITNYDADNVSVISTATNTVLTTIAVGTNPFGVSVAPDGSRVYVANLNSNNVSVISTATNTVLATIPVGTNPRGISVTPDGTRVYVANPNSNNVSVINTVNNTVLTTIPVGNGPSGISVTPDGTRVYVTNLNSNNVSVINTVTNTVLTTVPTGTTPSCISVSPNGATLYVTNLNSNNVSVISSATNTVLATIPVGTTPFGVSVSPDGTRVYVTNISSNNISVLNTATNTVLTTIPAATSPTGVSVSPDGTRVYVANFNSNNVFVIDAANNTVVATISAGISNPYAVGNFIGGPSSCTGTPKTFTITVNPAPTATISYTGSPYCAVGTATPTFSGTTGGTYSSTAGLSINATTGEINLATSTAGTYTVTYTIPPGNGCSQVDVTTTVTISPNAQVDQPASQILCSGSTTAPAAFSGGTAGVTYAWTNDNTSIGLGAAGTDVIPAFTVINNGTAPQVATITVTPQGGIGSCTGSAKTFTITVNPKPVLNPVTSQTVCAGASVAAITFGTSATGGTTTYSWTNSNTSVGLGAGGAGSIPSFTALNSSSTVQSASIVVTPMFTNGGPGCPGDAAAFNITVNPTPSVDAVASQNLCNGANTTAINFSGSAAGTVYSWTNNTTSIGLAASGTGNIASFAAINSGTAPVTALIVVTPTFSNGGQNCPGAPASFSITVNPTPTVNTVADQVLCNGATTAAVTFSGAIPNTAYSWTNTNTSIGLAPSGTGNIAAFAALNAGTAPITATITVTPSATLNGIAYVPNNGSGTVSMIDLTTGAVVGSPIAVGANPFGVTVLPDRSKVYVSNTGGNSVSVISTATNTVTGTSPYNAPHGLAASPDGLRVYVNGWTDNAVSRIDVASNVSTFMTNVTQPEGMAVSADGARLYVASSLSPGKLVVINANSNAVISSITVGDFPQGVTLSADGSKVYVVNNGSGTVSVISTASNSVVATIPVGSNPLAVAVSPDGTKAYVTNSGNNSLSVISTATNAVTATIPVGTYPYGVAVSPDGSTIYVANRNSNNVSVINAATNAVSSVAVGTAPIALGQFTTASLQCAGAPKTFTITVNPTPTVNAVTSQTHCAGAATTAVTFSGAVPGTVYSWTNSNPSIGLAASGSGNIASFTATNSTSTVQVATVTVTPTFTNGGQSCSGTPITFTITVNPTPTVAAVTNQTLCNGAATTAVNFSGAVAGTTYAWTNSNSSIGLAASGSGNIPSFTASNSGATVQTATITITPSANGCPGASTSFTITVNPTPSVNAVASQVLCNGATTTAVTFGGAVSGTVYSWTNSDPSIGLAASGSGDIAAFTAINNGTTPVIATVNVTPSFTNGGQTCTGTAGSFTITVNPTPTVNAVTNQTLCNGAATTAVTFSGAAAGSTFAWTNSAPSIGLAASGTGNIASFAASNGGTAPVTATITVTPSANGCSGSAQTFTITVNPTPSVAAVSPITVCAGQSIAVPNFSGPVASTTFSWTNDNTSIGLAASGTGNIAAFTAVNAGSTAAVANVTVTPTANGCPGNAVSFVITVNPLPTGTITAPNGTLICQGSSVPLQVSGGTSYQWLLGGTPVGTGATFNATQPGIYTVNITNSFGCTRLASNSITLTLVQKPHADFSFNSYCLNTPVTFTNNTATTGAGTVTYQWSFGNGQSSTLASPVTTYNTTGVFTVQLIASPNGCASLNDTVRKTITIEAPTAGQRLAPQDVVSGRATEIRARNLPNGHYSWNPSTGLSNPAIWYPLATLTQEQDYRIQVSFASGCVTVDSLLVRVQKGDDIFVPTAFSPNNDGVNDVLKPISVGLSSLRMFRIYDRMGREVFSSTNFQQGWDGLYRGQPSPADTYTWVAEGWDHNNQLIRKTGQVLLVR